MNMRQVLATAVLLLTASLRLAAQGNVDTYVAVNDAENANTFVVIISNEHYKHEEPVPFALNDGAVFQRYCEKTLGIPEKNIKFVPDASLNDMNYNLKWLERVVGVRGETANAIVYYSGHGMPDEDSKKAYLLPIDGYSTEPTSGLATDALYQRLSAMHTAHTVVMLDACFSGSKREGGMLSSSRGVAIKAKEATLSGNMIVFSAAQGNETAYPYKAKEHGLFTYYMLEKLQKTGGYVTMGELSDYVIKQVAEASITENEKSQTPMVAAATSATDWRNWTLTPKKATQYVNMPKPQLSSDTSLPAASTPQASTPAPTPVSPSAPAAQPQGALDMSAGGAFLLAGVVYEMVRINKGSFVMGTKQLSDGYSTFSLGKPAHEVTLKTYAIGKTEVSQALWEAVMGSNPSEHKGAKLPVENVSWDDCQVFIQRLNQLTGAHFRLPTEAEWEFAADCRISGMADSYSGVTRADAVAHRGSTTAECGSKSQSSIGLQDMSGNVAEWCQDYFGAYTSMRQTDPQGPDSGFQRVVRGGSFADGTPELRNSHRGHMKQAAAAPTVGLRLAHDIE